MITIVRRNGLWCAFHEGDERTNYVGYGTTEAAALDSLKRLDEERWNADQEGQWRFETGCY